jgi:hypothetical protein
MSADIEQTLLYNRVFAAFRAAAKNAPKPGEEDERFDRGPIGLVWVSKGKGPKTLKTFQEVFDRISRQRLGGEAVSRHQAEFCLGMFVSDEVKADPTLFP